MPDRSRDKPMFDRVVVKLSGEALMGPDPFGLNAPTVQRISADLKAVSELGVQVAVVVGGGNFFRGLLGAEGIAVVLRDQPLASLLPAVALANGGLTLLVAEDEVERAREVLAKPDSAEAAPDEGAAAEGAEPSVDGL